MRKVLREETGSLQDRWLIGAGSVVTVFLGVVLSVLSKPSLQQFVKAHSVYLGLGLISIAVVTLWLISRRR